MKTVVACGLAAAFSSFALAHPLQARQNATAPTFGTCSFDKATAFKTLTASNPPVSQRNQRKKRSCGSKSQSALSSSAVPSVAATSRRGGRRTSSTVSAAPTSTAAELSTSVVEATSAVSISTAAPSTGSVVVVTASSSASSAAASATSSTWDPPSSLATALDEVWEHEMSTYGGDPLTFKNYGYDHLIDTQANIQYCVRWDSTQSVTAAQRASIETALQKQYNKWVEGALAGFDGFPYTTANVKVVGWATNNTALLQGDVADGVTVHSSTLDANGIPECDPACGRAIHYTDGDYSGCAGGDAARYDVSLWLTDGLDGGFGGDWGQQVGTDYMLENLESENIHILLHEMGHTLALDDFYDWTPTGVTNFIMLAGSAMEITEFDAWMARDWWRHLKSRYSL